MARVNVYLPDELAEQARASGLSISKVTQDAIAAALARERTNGWMDTLERLPRVDVRHERAIDALDAARTDLGERAGR